MAALLAAGELGASLFIGNGAFGAGTPKEVKPRLLVLTDIGGDPDDQQSMIRLMTYANEFEIEGLIASASGTPGELKEQVTRPDLISEVLKAYGKVRPNLPLHRPDYLLPDRCLTVSSPATPGAASRTSARGTTRRARAGSSRSWTGTTRGR
jgi:hypothetical protein